MIQNGLIALFGLYLIIPGMLARLGFKYPEKIQRHFRAANFLMATSFFVAEVWHLSQSPGLVYFSLFPRREAPFGLILKETFASSSENR